MAEEAIRRRKRKIEGGDWRREKPDKSGGEKREEREVTAKTRESFFRERKLETGINGGGE